MHYGAAVAFSGTLYNAGKGGEVADYREADGAIRLTGDVTVGSRLVFMYGDGTMSPPLSFRSVGDGWIIVEGGVTNMNYADYATERTKYFVLEGQMANHLVKITAVEPRGMGNSGAPSYTLRGVVDVPEVHTCDNQWLPKEGEIQDDWNEPEDPEPVIPITLGPNYYIQTQRATWPNSGYPPTLKFYPDGRVTMKYYDLQRGIVEGTQNTITANPAYVGYEIQYNWYRGAPLPGVGQNYDAIIVIALDPAYTRFIYDIYEDNEPVAPYIFDGHFFYHDVNGEELRSNSFTAGIYNDLATRFPGKKIYVSGAVKTIGKSILSQEVEFKSIYDSFPGLPTPVIEGYVLIGTAGKGIKDTKFLAAAPIKMGMSHQM